MKAVISPSAYGSSEFKAESTTDPKRFSRSDLETTTAGGLRPQSPAAPDPDIVLNAFLEPRQLAVRGPKGLLSRNNDPHLNSRRGQKPQGSSNWIRWKAAPRLQTRTEHLMRFWVGARAGTSRPDRTAMCPNLAPNRLKP
ncbi:hypothetical protein PanWU01x14_308480 [Parasponia andersonii]|uniref:Uncharacterized protein n=1 Tax=Parasponia andersonii TaxID=3476 RepID=A0A2P5AQW7_PARAD|nr:hypothetical protein PanWU01x14_308480 [Parasponia andersonii]